MILALVVVERNIKNVVVDDIKLEGVTMEGIYLYKGKLEEIDNMVNELGVSL